MKEMVVLKDVSKIYRTGVKEFHALKHMDVSIEKGSFVVILGPSGAGKSTLLHLIGGMDIPTSGQVIIDGEDISLYNENKLSDYRARSVGFIFQFYNILPTLTVFENVEMVRDVAKNPLDSREALRQVGLLEHEHKFPNQLSGGEQQRVSIARAVAKNPKILLCDEPTGALDSDTGAEVLQLLQNQCRKEGHTVIIVTHNTLISEIADVIIRIKNGEIQSVVKNASPKKIEEVEW